MKIRKIIQELKSYSVQQDALLAKLNQNESPFDIPQEIKDWCGIDFDKWEEMRDMGKKPWVYQKKQYVEFI